MMGRLFTILLLLLACSPAVRAEPLDRRNLPAGAAWFVHLDCDAGRESQFGQRLRELWLQRPGSARPMARARQLLGIDLTRDIRSITLYSLSFAPDTAVLIARGKVDRATIQRTLKTLPGFHSEAIEGRDVYFWNEIAPNRRRQSAGAFFGDDRLVIAPDGPSLLAALGVLEGKQASLAEGSALGGRISKVAIVQAAAAGLSEARELSAESPIVRRCESGWLSLEERGGELVGEGEIVTESPETAQQLVKLIQGAQALGELTGNPNVASVSRPLTIVAKEKSAEIHWRYSAVELVKIIQNQPENRAPATERAGDS